MLMMIPVLLGVTFIVFTLMYFTPGDPIQMLLGDMARPEDIAALTEQLGLNDPFIIRFINYVIGIVTRFDFGISFVTGQPVAKEILSRFPNTLLLAVLGVSLSVVVGVICGVIAATKQYSVFDSFATATSLVGVSMPSFWLGLLLIVFFSINLRILPASGSYGWQFWILPALTIASNGTASIMRMTRSSMLEVVRMDYIRTARAKGQSERVVIMYHALKNALIPVITVIGIQFGYLLGGSVITETIFAIPGVGRFSIDAIRQRDFPVVQGSVLFLAFCFSIVNLLVDILYAYIDPRIATQYRTVKKKN
jgi:peptide/nickel transport system permease protein